MTGVDDDQCHLMVQLMESWFLTDVEALESYYGSQFARGSLPRNPRIEEIAKKDVEESLEAATRHTQKGRYHKTRHAPELLERVNPTKVRKAASHCERLFATLLEIVNR